MALEPNAKINGWMEPVGGKKMGFSGFLRYVVEARSESKVFLVGRAFFAEIGSSSGVWGTEEAEFSRRLGAFFEKSSPQFRWRGTGVLYSGPAWRPAEAGFTKYKQRSRIG